MKHLRHLVIAVSMCAVVGSGAGCSATAAQPHADPRGRTFAYTTSDSFVVVRDGTTTATVAGDYSSDAEPLWTADGALAVAYDSRGTLAVVDGATGRTDRVLCEDCADFVAGPERKVLAVESGRRLISIDLAAEPATTSVLHEVALDAETVDHMNVDHMNLVAATAAYALVQEFDGIDRAPVRAYLFGLANRETKAVTTSSDFGFTSALGVDSGAYGPDRFVVAWAVSGGACEKRSGVNVLNGVDGVVARTAALPEVGESIYDGGSTVNDLWLSGGGQVAVSRSLWKCGSGDEQRTSGVWRLNADLTWTKTADGGGSESSRPLGDGSTLTLVSDESTSGRGQLEVRSPNVTSLVTAQALRAAVPPVRRKD